MVKKVVKKQKEELVLRIKLRLSDRGICMFPCRAVILILELWIIVVRVSVVD